MLLRHCIIKDLLAITLIVALPCLSLAQQLSGSVIDHATGNPIPYAKLAYINHSIQTLTTDNGHFSMLRHNGWVLTVSAIGYENTSITIDGKTETPLIIELRPDATDLKEVVISGKRKRYRRRGNPAVDLMESVIGAAPHHDPRNQPYYQYNLHQKLTVANNAIKPRQLKRWPFSKHPWLLQNIDLCPDNQKLILPVEVIERHSHHFHTPDSNNDAVREQALNVTGITTLFSTGEVVSSSIADLFVNIDIYDQQVRLLQERFLSPIARGATLFYRYYIIDTVAIDNDSCVHLEYIPNNQQDFGFSGHIYVTTDSLPMVRRCVLQLPKHTNVNFIDNMLIDQEFVRQPNGPCVKTHEHSVIEMSTPHGIPFHAIVLHTALYKDYNFDSVPSSVVSPLIENDSATLSFEQIRTIPLTNGEAAINPTIERLGGHSFLRTLVYLLKTGMEGYAETGHPSKIDIGPVKNLASNNFIDGWRFRIGGKTTAALNRHLFAEGFYAYGTKSHKHYYNAQITYSINPKKRFVYEYPERSISILSTSDVGTPADRTLVADKDNIFVSWQWDKVDKMLFYHRQQVTLTYETSPNLRAILSLLTEEDQPCGSLLYHDMAGNAIASFRLSQMQVALRFAPGERYIYNKNNRMTINNDPTVLTLSHTIGMKDLLGGEYNYNITQASIYQRFWIGSWGRIDARLSGAILWDQAPYPILPMPPSNMSYWFQDNSFRLLNSMEFLNDRYATLLLAWDMNGKLLNRLPILHFLHWREYLAFNMLWGSLSDKNNPTLATNSNTSNLMQMPAKTYLMDYHTPYAEVVIGVHNIFKLLHVEYVRRLNYLDKTTARKHGIRMGIRVSF